MAAYPLIDDDAQLVALDGWLVDLLDVAMQKRGRPGHAPRGPVPRAKADRQIRAVRLALRVRQRREL